MVPFPGQRVGRRPDTVEQLRRDIDSGRMRDKVCVHDPAAVPLGADEEAAGTPLSPDAISHARGSAGGVAAAQEGAAARQRLRRRQVAVAVFASLVALVGLSVWMTP